MCANKTVGVSFKEIYKENGANLKYGGYIDFYDDGENEYYDLRTNTYGSLLGSSFIAYDGEEFVVQSETDDFYILKSCENECEIYLSKDEYSIGVFQ